MFDFGQWSGGWQMTAFLSAYLLVGITVMTIVGRCTGVFSSPAETEHAEKRILATVTAILWPLILGFILLAGVVYGLGSLIVFLAGED